MNERQERIVVETERYRLTGTVRLSAEGYRSRLTDHLNAGEHDFIALTDVDVVPLDPAHGTPSRHRFVALARRHVVFATSAEGDGATSA